MHRCWQTDGNILIVDLPVGYSNYPRHPSCRKLGQGGIDRGQQTRSSVVLAVFHLDPHNFGVVPGRQRIFKISERLFRLRGSIRKRLAGCSIFGQNDNVRQRASVFLLKGWSNQRAQNHQPSQATQSPTFEPAPNRQNDARNHDQRQSNQNWQWDQRVNDNA